MDRQIGMFRTDRHARRRLLSIALAACLLIPGLLITSLVSAQDGQVKLAIVPVGAEGGYFDLMLEPGETRELSVQLSNRGTAAITARTYPADAYTIVNGGFAARLADEQISGTTHWIDYRDETLNLESGETVTRTFTLSVPEDAQPGQYITSLVIQNAEPIDNNPDAGIGFNQVIRQTIAVAIRVPGPDAPALQIGEASHAMVAGLSVISVEVMNPGNVHLVPHGEFTLIDASGVEVARVPLQMATVYAGAGTLVEAPLPMLLEAGAYTATLALQDDSYGTRAESGRLPLSIPVLEAPQQAQVPEPVADPATEPVTSPRAISIPIWALLMAIPATVLLSALVALAVVLGLRRRSVGRPDIQPRSVVTPAAAPPHRPAVIRQLIPPSRAVIRPLIPPTRAVIRPLIPPFRAAELKGKSQASQGDAG